MTLIRPSSICWTCQITPKSFSCTTKPTKYRLPWRMNYRERFSMKLFAWGLSYIVFNSQGASNRVQRDCKKLSRKRCIMIYTDSVCWRKEELNGPWPTWNCPWPNWDPKITKLLSIVCTKLQWVVMMTNDIYSIMVSNRSHMDTAKLAKNQTNKVFISWSSGYCFFLKHNHLFFCVSLVIALPR